jgi:hypothetical protein
MPELSLARKLVAKRLFGVAGLLTALILVVAGRTGAELLPIVINPQFDIIDMLNPNGTVATDGGGNPITGTMDPSSYTFDTSFSTYPGFSYAGLNYGTIHFSNGDTYNSTTGGCPQIAVPGWMTTKSDGAQGVEHGASSSYASEPYFLFVNGEGFTGQASEGYLIYQDLGPASACLTPGHTYTLSVDVGLRGNSYSYTLDSNVVAALYIGSAPSVDSGGHWLFPAQLAGTAGTPVQPSPAGGTFATWQMPYTTLATIPSGDLYIVLGTYSPSGEVTGDQVDFTNVAITAPEPASLLLLACGGAIVLPHRRRS